MTKKLLTTIGAVVIVGLALLIGVSLLNGGGVNASQKFAVPRSFASAAAFDTNTAIFSNGQALATYNFASGQVEPLSGNVGLNDIDTVSVSPDGNLVVFHDQFVNQTGALAAQLRAHGLDSSLDYWWLYDAQNQTYQPLPQGVLMAKVDNTHVYALASSGSGETITTYQPTTLNAESSINIPGSSNFFASNGGFLLQTPDNKVLFTKNGTVNQVLFTSTLLAGVTQNGASAVGVTTNGSTRNLVVINLRTNASTVVAGDVANQPALLNSGIVLYANSQNQLHAYNLATGKTKLWNLGSNSNGFTIASTKLVALLGPSAALVDNQSGNYYLIGSGLAPTSAL
jgi:hypothetical protein